MDRVWRWAPWPMLATGLFLIFYKTDILAGHRSSDFVIFHNAIQRAMADPATLYLDGGSDVGETARSLQGFLYPPPSYFFLYPFGSPSLDTGFALLSVGALVAALLALATWLFLLRRDDNLGLPWLSSVALIVLAAATGPVFSNRFGQIDTLILLLCVLGIALARSRHPFWGGAVLAAGGWIKVYPGLLMLPLLFDREARSRLLAGFACGAAVFAGAAALVFPVSLWRVFFVDMLPLMSERTIVNIYNQSLLAIGMRLHIDPVVARTTYDSIVVAPVLRLLVLAAGLGTIIAVSLMARARGTGRMLVPAIALAVISLIAPLGWGHSYAYVLPLLISIAVLALVRRQAVLALIAAACWALLVLPAHSQPTLINDGPFALWWLFHARYAIAAVVLIAVGCWLVAANRQPITPLVAR